MQHQNDMSAPAAMSSVITGCGSAEPHGELALKIIRQVALKNDVPIELILSPNRCKRPIAHARQHAMYLAHVAAGFTMSAVGDIFGRDRTTIRHACACVEDRRDDVAFDTYISHLEAEIEQLVESGQ